MLVIITVRNGQKRVRGAIREVVSFKWEAVDMEAIKGVEAVADIFRDLEGEKTVASVLTGSPTMGGSGSGTGEADARTVVEVGIRGVTTF